MIKNAPPTVEEHRLRKIRIINEIMGSSFALATTSSEYEKDFLKRSIQFNYEFVGRMEVDFMKSELSNEANLAKEKKVDEEIQKQP